MRSEDGDDSGRILVLVAVVLAAIMFVFPLTIPFPLLDPDEGLHASIAQEMVERGNWTMPQFLGRPFLDKPIFFFWVQAASLRLLGPERSGGAAARIDVRPARRNYHGLVGRADVRQHDGVDRGHSLYHHDLAHGDGPGRLPRRGPDSVGDAGHSAALGSRACRRAAGGAGCVLGAGVFWGWPFSPRDCSAPAWSAWPTAAICSSTLCCNCR